MTEVYGPLLDELDGSKARPAGPSKESRLMLGVLSLLVKQGRYRMYEGTANPGKVARRHAKNRVAKQSRKANRGR